MPEHSTTDFSTLNKEELLTNLRKELLNSKKSKLIMLGETIKKRYEIKNYIGQALQALNSFKMELKQMEEENNNILTSLISQLTEENGANNQEECIQPYLAELFNQIDEKNYNSIQILTEQLKTKFSIQQCHDENLEEKFTTATAQVTDIEKEKKLILWSQFLTNQTSHRLYSGAETQSVNPTVMNQILSDAMPFYYLIWPFLLKNVKNVLKDKSDLCTETTSSRMLQ